MIAYAWAAEDCAYALLLFHPPVKWLTPGEVQVVRAEAGVPLHALQAWLLARGWELGCTDGLPRVAGEATVGSLLGAWGGSLAGPRVHALTVVDHTGQVGLVSMVIEAVLCLAMGRAGESLHKHKT